MLGSAWVGLRSPGVNAGIFRGVEIFRWSLDFPLERAIG